MASLGKDYADREVIVQQGEPQHILLNPNDPYIEDFVSDINRARVLRVRSIMTPLNGAPVPPEAQGEVGRVPFLIRLLW